MSEFILPHDITRVTSLKTVGEMLRANGIETAQRDARLLMLAAAGIVHADLLREPRLPLGEEVAERLSNWIRQRLERVPVARILGEWEFWSLPFTLAPETLVPRPDSETVVADTRATACACWTWGQEQVAFWSRCFMNCPVPPGSVSTYQMRPWRLRPSMPVATISGSAHNSSGRIGTTISRDRLI